jgi:hypothetical protein
MPSSWSRGPTVDVSWRRVAGGVVVGWWDRAPPRVVDAAVDLEGQEAAEAEHGVRGEQVSLQVAFPHPGPSDDGGVTFQAFDAGQQAVGEGGLVLAVVCEAVVDAELAELPAVDAGGIGGYRGVVVVADPLRFGLGVVRSEDRPAAGRCRGRPRGA